MRSRHWAERPLKLEVSFSKAGDEMALLNPIAMNLRLKADCLLFDGLIDMEIEQILNLCDQRFFSKGRTVLREGLVDQSLWCVLSGRCVVVRTVQGGVEHQFATLGPGDVFGEVSFFSRSGHSATVRTLEDVELIQLRRERFDELSPYGSLAQKLAQNVSTITARKFRRLENYTLRLLDRPSVEGEETIEPKAPIPLALYRPSGFVVCGSEASHSEQSRWSPWGLVTWSALIAVVAIVLWLGEEPDRFLMLLK
ncbi:MAG: hypothetical protein CMJ78_22225 [Planctomycetaceae bacterium]|nr:hypothetical protein [Planctomycetaceae bacterium]